MAKSDLKVSHFLKTSLILALLLAGFYSLYSEVYFDTEAKLSTVEPKVLAASTAPNLTENTFPNMRPAKLTVSTVSAVPTKQTDFEVRLPILTYHRVRDVLLISDRSDIEFSVSPKNLDEQLKYLADNNYQTISLDELNARFENKSPLPPKSVILTFDDGFRDFYTNAFPLLKKYNLRAVCFYIVGYSNFPGYMDQMMLREIHDSGLVDIQSHTLSHLLLPNLTIEDQKREILESKQILEVILDKKINYFAYPYGSFDQNTVNIVSDSGYTLGFGTTPGLILKTSQRLTLPRISISGFDTIQSFSQKLGLKDEDLLPPNDNILPTVQEKTTTTSAKVN